MRLAPLGGVNGRCRPTMGGQRPTRLVASAAEGGSPQRSSLSATARCPATAHARRLAWLGALAAFVIAPGTAGAAARPRFSAALMPTVGDDPARIVAVDLDDDGA